MKSDDPSSPDFVPSVFPAASAATRKLHQHKYVTLNVKRKEAFKKLREQVSLK